MGLLGPRDPGPNMGMAGSNSFPSAEKRATWPHWTAPLANPRCQRPPACLELHPLDEGHNPISGPQPSDTIPPRLQTGSSKKYPPSSSSSCTPGPATPWKCAGHAKEDTGQSPDAFPTPRGISADSLDGSSLNDPVEHAAEARGTGRPSPRTSRSVRSRSSMPQRPPGAKPGSGRCCPERSRHRCWAG